MRRKLKRKAANRAMLKENEEKRKKKGRKGVFEEGPLVIEKKHLNRR